MVREVQLHQQVEQQVVPRMALNRGAMRKSPVDAPFPRVRNIGLKVSFRVKV